MQATSAQIRKCAGRIVDLYAIKVSITLVLQGELERKIIAELVPAPDPDVSDWISIVNRALDEWELAHPTRGPRVGSISPATATVFERPRRPSS